MFGLTGVGGSLSGSALNRRLDPDLLLLAFAGLVLIAAWRMLIGCPSCTKVGEQEAISVSGTTKVVAGLRIDAATMTKVVAAGTLVGFFTGLFGVGGGFIIVPALTLGLHFAMPEAIGTSLLIIAVNSAVALGPRLGEGGIDWAVTVPFAVSTVVGTLVGSRLADRLPARGEDHAPLVRRPPRGCVRLHRRPVGHSPGLAGGTDPFGRTRAQHGDDLLCWTLSP